MNGSIIMTKLNLFDRLNDSSAPLLTDGAMGTMIHTHGVDFDQSFDALNLSQPAIIAEIHRAYIEAGAEIVITNTFGANRYRLAKHGMENQVVEVNQAAVELARRVMLASFKDLYLAGDVGPLGVRLAPYGRVSPEEAYAAFHEQITALVDAGVDMLIIETMTDLYEIREAVAAARAITDIPILASMAFTREDRTLLGNKPEEVAQALHETGANIIGINCSDGPTQLLRILRRMRRAVPDAHYSVIPNAGLPEQVGGRIMYPAGAAYFGEYAEAFRHAGARVIGGCCGTTPNHIREMRAALDRSGEDVEIPHEFTPKAPPELLPPSQQDTLLNKKMDAGDFVFTVEMSPPRGLAIEKTLASASMLKEAGVDFINAADSPRARMRMSPWALANLLRQNLDIESILHFPTRGRNLLRVQGDLLAAHALNVRNIFVVMGDPTAIGDYPEAMDNFDVAPSGLVKLIKQGFNAGQDYAGSNIGEATNFFVGTALSLTPAKPEREMKVLRRKLKAGADFALTQPLYEPEKAREFIQAYQEKHGAFDLPLIVGVLPLYSPRHAAFLHNEVPGINIPDEIMHRIETAANPAREGVQIAIETILQLRDFARGVYLMPPFGRYYLAAEIVEAVKHQVTG